MRRSHPGLSTDDRRAAVRGEVGGPNPVAGPIPEEVPAAVPKAASPADPMAALADPMAERLRTSRAAGPRQGVRVVAEDPTASMAA